MRRILFLVLSIFVLHPTFAQLSKKMAQDTIIWKKDSALTKDCFKTKSSGSAPAFSSIAIVTYQREYNGNMLYYVDAIFLKSKSFMKDESIYSLKHQQLHFDICELFARKLRQRISKRDFRRVTNIEKTVRVMYDKIVDEWQIVEEKFDKDTQNGLNAAKQQVWTDKIAAQLTALDQFTSTGVDIVKR